MNHHIEEQVATVEERALQLSLTGVTRFERDELAEMWQNVYNLERRIVTEQRLKERLAAVKAELSGLEHRLQGKGSLPPVAA